MADREVGNGSEPTARILKVLRFAAGRYDQPFTLHEAASETGVPKATLLRIIRTLVGEGYLAGVGKRYESNVVFETRLPVSPDHIARLDAVLEDLAEYTGQTAEVITAKVPDLLWLKKRESSRISVRVVARPGVTRSIYELDAPARLYLKSAGIDYVRRELVPGFFHAGPNKRELSDDDALAWIESIDESGVEYDVEGNSNGIRRYVAAVSGDGDRFLYLIAVAEPATPRNNERKHLDEMIAALERARRHLLERTPS
mgnify:CR=1 FL=1